MPVSFLHLNSQATIRNENYVLKSEDYFDFFLPFLQFMEKQILALILVMSFIKPTR